MFFLVDRCVFHLLIIRLKKKLKTFDEWIKREKRNWSIFVINGDREKCVSRRREEGEKEAKEKNKKNIQSNFVVFFFSPSRSSFVSSSSRPHSELLSFFIVIDYRTQVIKTTNSKLHRHSCQTKQLPASTSSILRSLNTVS